MANQAPLRVVSLNEKTADIAQIEHGHSSTANSVEMSDLKASETIDTLHNDEALKVLQNYSGDESWSPSEEKQVQRIIDWRLMPCLCATYCLQYYDKAMLGQAVRSPICLICSVAPSLSMYCRHNGHPHQY